MQPQGRPRRLQGSARLRGPVGSGNRPCRLRTRLVDRRGESATGPSGCPAAHARAQAAVRQAEKTDVPWDGPAGGPTAVSGRTIVYVAQTMTNPGVAGTAKGVREAARVIGWNVRVIDGGGTPPASRRQ